MHRLLLALVTVLLLALPVLGDPAGALDTSFGGSGKTITPVDAFDGGCYGLARQPDGKIVAVGSSAELMASGWQRFSLVAMRLHSNGSIDTTFGTSGRVVLSGGPDQSTYGFGAIVQADGKIAIAGDWAGQFVIVRLLSSGALDTTFGSGGIATAGGGAAFSMALQPDGRLLACGFGIDGSSITDSRIVRFNADGTLDTSFSADGIVINPDAFMLSIALQPDGRIVAAGGSATAAKIARYNPDGTFDGTFGTGGISSPFLAPDGSIVAMALDPDGRIAVAGALSGQLFVGRLTSSGALDATFGTSGVIFTNLETTGPYVNAILVQPDHKIVVAGNGFLAEEVDHIDFAVARFRENGTLDSSFSSDGIDVMRTSVYYDEARAVLLQPDGRVLLGGLASNGSVDTFALARYKTNGALDPAFDADGFAFPSLADQDDIAHAVTVAPDGTILVAGASGPYGTVARYLANGSLDTSFGRGGLVVLALAPESTTAFYGVAVHADGRIALTGDAGGEFVLIGLTPTGNLDLQFAAGAPLFQFTGMVQSGGGRAIAVQADGKIVAAGFGVVDGVSQFAVTRVDTEGYSDQEFGEGGTVLTTIGDGAAASAIALQSDGAIVAAGYALGGTNYDFAVARYASSGALDTTWTTDLGQASEGVQGVLVQPDGGIVCAGRSGGDFGLTRHNANGTLDSSFDGDGRVITSFGPGTDGAMAVALRNGRITAAGFAWNGANYDFALARYTSGGALDTTFDGDGKVMTDVGGDDEIRAMALQTNGKMVVAGWKTGAGLQEIAVARYLWGS